MTDQQKQEYEAVFTRAAAAYGQVGPGYFAHFGRRLVEFACLPPGARLLDIACGRGAVLFPAAEKVGPAGEVTGVDLSAGMVAETRREIAARSIPNARVMQMDAEQLQFPDGSFDGVLCGFALFFFPNLGRALAEIRRVLAPGGMVAVSTWGTWDERWKWLDDLFKAYLPPALQGEPEPEAAPDFHSPAGLEAILSGAGFGGLRAEIVREEFAFRSEAEWWSTSWSHGSRYALEKIERALGPAGLERFKAEAFAHLQSFRAPAGFPQRMEVVLASGRAGDKG